MGHTHSHAPNATGWYMGLAVLVTLAFVLGETVAGCMANSLALLSDAGHNFADALALMVSWYAVGVARKRANSQRTFGYHRVGILAALVNAVSLVVIALFIFWEALHRFRHAEPVQSGLMIGVALVAVVMNGVISLWLRRDAHHDLNVRSAYLHMVGDAVAALGVAAAGVAVALTGASVADPMVSVLIGAMILWSSWGILSEAVNILLESAPKGIDMAALEAGIKNTQGVLDVHDLHVWTVASGIIACCCHILVAEQSVRGGQQILTAVAHVLNHQFGITHTTVQVEVEGCEPNELYCTLQKVVAKHTCHDHAENE